MVLVGLDHMVLSGSRPHGPSGTRPHGARGLAEALGSKEVQRVLTCVPGWYLTEGVCPAVFRAWLVPD